MSAFYTLFLKEFMRFWKVSLQTLLAPILTTLLYQLVFSHAMSTYEVKGFGTVSYVAFLIPGLVMMTMLQNAFANPSSSLIQSKITGNIIYMLLPPLSHWEIYAAYVLAALVRALMVGVGVLCAALLFVDHMPALHSPVFLILFALLSGIMLGSLGVIAGLWAEKFDQLAGFQNFIIMPLTFLSGVFYSLHSLPTIWSTLSHFNPFFYMIDGFRYGFFGYYDVDPRLSLVVVSVTTLLLAVSTIVLLKRGYKLRY